MEQQFTADLRQEDAAFIIAGWSVVLSTLRIHKQGKSVKLEPKVMAVLEYLASRPGQVVSRQELEDSVWRGTVVGYDAISNAIIKLRKAFGDDAHNAKIIETIPKTGYRLIAPVEVQPGIDLQSHGEDVVVETAQSVPVEASAEASPRSSYWKTIIASTVALLVLLTLVSVLLEPWVSKVEPASIDRMAFPLPDKPSIAVLPFTNMSADPEQEYFVDGITEDLITDLSKLDGLFVVARNSVFTYKGRAVKIRQVAEELGVRYVLEGSVRRSGEQVRINAQLIDALSGGHVWAERYDGVNNDVFALQDEVVREIVAQLAVELSLEDAQALAQTETVDETVNDLFQKGWGHYRAGTAQDYAEALNLFRRALELDPEFARAQAALAAVYWNILRRNWYREILDVYYTRANELFRLALRKSQEMPTALTHQIASESIAYYSRSPRRALAEAQTAINLEPNDPAGHLALGNAFLKMEKPLLAEQSIRQAMRLDPHYPAFYLVRLAQAQFHLEQYDGAAKSLEAALARVPDDDWAWLYLAASDGQLGKIEKAAEALQRTDQLRADLGWGRITQLAVASKLFRWQGDKTALKAGLKIAGAPTGGEWYPLITVNTITDSNEHRTESIEGVAIIGVDKAREMHDRGVVFIDVLNVWFSAHIPGAYFLETWKDQPESWLFNEASLAKLVAKDEEVVIYGASPFKVQAAYASALAVSRGFGKVFYFEGGLDAWQAAGYPTEKAQADGF